MVDDPKWHDGPPRWTEVAGIVWIDRGAGPLLPVLDSVETALLTARVRDRWGDLIREHAERTGLPASWIGGFMFAESMGDPNAGSSAGAVGLLQLMPQFYGGNAGGRLFDPDLNVQLGSDTIAQHRAKGYALPEIASMYNAGPSKTGGAKRTAQSGVGYEFGFVQNPGYIARVVRASNTWAKTWPDEARDAPDEGPPRIPFWALTLTAKLLGWLVLPLVCCGGA